MTASGFSRSHQRAVDRGALEPHLDAGPLHLVREVGDEPAELRALGQQLRQQRLAAEPRGSAS